MKTLLAWVTGRRVAGATGGDPTAPRAPSGRLNAARDRLASRLRRPAARRTAAAAMIAAVGVAAWIRLGPLPAGLLDEADAVRSTTVYDRNGEVLYEARSDLGTREMRLRADRLPPALVGATLAAEDHRFHSHWGVDPIALARASWRNVAALDRIEGGSTLTQQVAKLLLDRRAQLAAGTSRPAPAVVSRRRGWGAKIEEAIVALRLEHRLSKADLLALYLNLAPYGNQIAGAERASHAYFGTDASMLTPAQAAFIAALPQRPSRFNPWRSVAQATARQRVVLARMERRGFIDASAAAIARAERLRLAEEDARFLAPHFVGMVLADLPDPKPARVVTTLDAALQRTIEGIVRSQRPLLEKHGATNVAIVVLDNTTSQWLAWEGSGNHGGDRGGSINGPMSLRQPGSALKPFTYALAFESGENPASVLPDVPASFPTAEDGVVYTPRNYDGRFRGPLLARAALAGSINVPAVALASDLGVANVLRFLRRAGFTTFDKTAAHYGLGLTLGNAEVRLDELTAAYAAFARGGEWRPARARLDPEPRVAEPVQLVSPRTAYWITDILADDDARAFIFGRGSQLEFPFPVAVKTGTSQAYHDNWTVGSSRHVTVGVWVGNFDRSPLIGSSGVTGAGPLFHAVMLAAEARVAGRITPHDGAVLAPPAPLVEATICGLSGRRAGDACPVRRRERVAPDAAQVAGAPCTWHHASGGELLTIWPDRYRAWAEANGLRSPRERGAEVRLARLAAGTGASGATGRDVTGRDVTGRGATERAEGLDVSAAARASRPAAALHVAHPAEGTVFLIDPTLRPEFQAVPLRAGGAGGGQVSWTVDGRAVGAGGGDGAVLWPLQRGSHVAVVRDGRGRTATVTFVVK